MANKKKNWKTTTGAVLTSVGIVCGVIAAAIDGDPETVVDLQGGIAAVGAIIATFGVSVTGISAQDADK